MLNEIYTTGMSSISVSRTSKGDYSYDIKIYHSGKGRSPFTALKRIDEMRRDLEKRLGIAGAPGEEEAAPGIHCPFMSGGPDAGEPFSEFLRRVMATIAEAGGPEAIMEEVMKVVSGITPQDESAEPEGDKGAKDAAKGKTTKVKVAPPAEGAKKKPEEDPKKTGNDGKQGNASKPE